MEIIRVSIFHTYIAWNDLGNLVSEIAVQKHCSNEETVIPIDSRRELAKKIQFLTRNKSDLNTKIFFKSEFGIVFQFPKSENDSGRLPNFQV